MKYNIDDKVKVIDYNDELKNNNNSKIIGYKTKIIDIIEENGTIYYKLSGLHGYFPYYYLEKLEFEGEITIEVIERMSFNEIFELCMKYKSKRWCSDINRKYCIILQAKKCPENYHKEKECKSKHIYSKRHIGEFCGE